MSARENPKIWVMLSVRMTWQIDQSKKTPACENNHESCPAPVFWHLNLSCHHPPTQIQTFLSFIMVLSSFLFENVEELTEEGLPFVILFHNPDDTDSYKEWKDLVKKSFWEREVRRASWLRMGRMVSSLLIPCTISASPRMTSLWLRLTSSVSSPNTRTDILLDTTSFDIKIHYYFAF